LPVQAQPLSADSLSRRAFAGGLLLSTGAFAAAAPPKRVAAIVTVYHHNSHADVIVSRILQSHTLDGKGTWPPGAGWPKLKLVSLYIDQEHEKDIGKRLAAEHGVPIMKTIAEALTLGGKSLAVDGVLLIGEHGKYPLSESGQIMYPRRRFLEETAAVFRQTGRSVPVFSDKHLSWNWADAKWMYDTSRELNFPMMAGSSVPGLWRRPALEMQLGARATEAVVLSYGPIEGYSYHGLEALQCLVERRKGGETGVAAVQFVEGPQVWEEMKKGRFSRDVFQAALDACENKAWLKKPPEEQIKNPAAFFIEYRDGFKAALVHGLREWVVAWREEGRKDYPATAFWTQEARPFGHFGYLLQGVEKMIYTGKPTWPVERTLLVTGVLAGIFESRRQGGKRLETPHLNVAYTPTFTWRDPGPPPTGRPLQGQ